MIGELEFGVMDKMVELSSKDSRYSPAATMRRMRSTIWLASSSVIYRHLGLGS
jgi:hypothetical protein